jgi:hypothetical protein
VDIKQCDPFDQGSIDFSEAERSRLKSVQNARVKSVRLMVAPQCQLELKKGSKQSFPRIRNFFNKNQKKHESVKPLYGSDDFVCEVNARNPMFQSQ